MPHSPATIDYQVILEKNVAMDKLIEPQNIGVTEQKLRTLNAALHLGDFCAIHNYPNHHRTLYTEHMMQMPEMQALLSSGVVPQSAAWEYMNAIYDEAYKMCLVAPLVVGKPRVSITYPGDFIEIDMGTATSSNRSNTGDKLHLSIDDMDPNNVNKAWEIIAYLAEQHGINGFKILVRTDRLDEKGRQFTLYLHDQKPEKVQQLINAIEYYFIMEQIKPDRRGMPDDCPGINGSQYISYRNDHFDFVGQHYLEGAPPGYLARDVIDCAKMVLSGTPKIDDDLIKEKFGIEEYAIENFKAQVMQVVKYTNQHLQQNRPVAWHDVMGHSQLGRLSVSSSPAMRHGYHPFVAIKLDHVKSRQQAMKAEIKALTDKQLQDLITQKREVVAPVGHAKKSPYELLKERNHLAHLEAEQQTRQNFRT